MKLSNKLIFLLLIQLISLTVIGQNNKLKISGTLFAEKAGAKNVRIIIIEIKNKSYDTIQIKNVIPRKKPTVGDFNIDLLLNSQYKVVFEGDTIFQETRYFDISTKINEEVNPKDYLVKDLTVNIWIRNRIKKEGEIYFDKMDKEFKVIRME